MIKKTYANTLTTTEQTLYEVPLGRKAQWAMLYATNISHTTKNFNVKIYKSAQSTTLTLFDEFKVNPKEFFKIGGGENEFVMLEEGDKVLVTGSANDSITLVLSLVEYNDIVKGG
jgi:hypothetical protein